MIGTQPQGGGIAALLGQGQMPQVGQRQGPGPATAPAPTLKGTDPHILQMALLGMVPGMQPSSALAALNEQVKSAELDQAAQAQMAMQQAQMLQGEPPIRDQVVQKAAMLGLDRGIGGQNYGYAGGGIVAFQKGGITDTEKATLVQMGVPAAEIDAAVAQGFSFDDIRRGDHKVAQTQPVKPPSFLERIRAQHEGDRTSEMVMGGIRRLAAGQPLVEGPLVDKPLVDKLADIFRSAPSAPPAEAAVDDDLARVSRRQMLIPTAPAPAPDTARSLGREAAAKTRPTVPPPVSAPAVDPYAEYMTRRSAELEAAGKPTAEVVRARQAEDAAREEAFKKREAIADRLRREAEEQRGRLSSYEREPIDTTEALLNLAAAFGGTKTFAEGIGKGAQTVTAMRQQRRKEAQEMRKELLQRQTALDELDRVNADLVVTNRALETARTTGDAEAVRKASEARTALLKEKADLQRALSKEKSEAELRGAQAEQARATAGYMGRRDDGSEGGGKADRTAATLMRADPRYQSIQKELTDARQMAGISRSPAAQQRLEKAEKAAVDLAAEYGIKIGGASGATPGAGRVIDFQSIK